MDNTCWCWLHFRKQASLGNQTLAKLHVRTHASVGNHMLSSLGVSEASLGRKPHVDAGSILGNKLRSETELWQWFMSRHKPWSETACSRIRNVWRQASVGNHMQMLALFQEISFFRAHHCGDASCEDTSLGRKPHVDDSSMFGGKPRSETTC